MRPSLSILLIEDSEDDALLLLRELRRAGYDVQWERVYSAPALREALGRGPWDLVISDYAMPGFGIMSALELVREQNRDLPFIIVSGAISEDTAVAAMRAGAHDYVMKDNLTRLVPAIESELREAKQRRERQAALELLRQSEERYRLLVENMSDAVVCVGLDGVITYASPQVRALVGREPADVVGHSFREMVSAECVAYIDEQLALVRSDQGDRIHDVAVLRVDGRPVPVEASVTPLFDGHGTPLGVQAILRDTSERRRAEQDLREAHHQLMRIIEFLPDATFVIDRHRRVVAWNHAVEEMTGVAKEEIIGRGDYAYAVPFYGKPRPILVDLVGSDVPETAEGYDHIDRVGETLYTEAFVPSVFGGRGAYLWATASPLYDEHGALVGAIESVRDVTARKLAERALRESEERFRGLFDGIPACCYTFASDGMILDWNRRCTAVYGWEAHEAVGQHVCELVVAREHAERMQDSVAAVFRGESFQGVELEAVRSSGEPCHLLVNLYSLKDAAGRVLMGMSAGLDITAHKRLTEQLRQSQRMEAIGQLAGGVAHDFNNLLTIIIGCSQFVLRALDPRDPLRQDAQEILAAGERAAALTRQLLAFSRRQVLDMRVVDLNQILEGTARMLPRLIGEHIALEVRLAPDLGHVRADAGQIEQVVINLVVNARDAMADGGRLVIETANIGRQDELPGYHGPRQEGGYVMLAVHDTGCGMSPEVKERLFEPFFTTKGPGVGTGLGLSTVYGIVKQSDGEITVESEVGAGSTFRVYLPCVDVMDATAETMDSTRAPRGTEKVLVLEDQGEVCRLIARMLWQLGYRVIEATSGGEALERLRQSGEAVDLVLTDVVMPEMGGRAFVEALRAVCPGFGVVYMSGYIDSEVFVRDVANGDAPFIQKPFTVDDLGRKLREALDGRGAC